VPGLDCHFAVSFESYVVCRRIWGEFDRDLSFRFIRPFSLGACSVCHWREAENFVQALLADI
jgi:hypothetical protein